MSTEKLINELITVLDKNDDYFLIFMLKYKISEIQKKENFDYKSKYSITDINFNKTKGMIKRHLKDSLKDFDNPEWYKKIKKITNVGCEKCKHHKKELFLGNLNFYPDYDSLVCNSCLIRTDKLEEITFKFDNAKSEYIFNELITPDIINLKAIVGKISRKLTNFKTKNYDAS